MASTLNKALSPLYCFRIWTTYMYACMCVCGSAGLRVLRRMMMMIWTTTCTARSIDITIFYEVWRVTDIVLCFSSICARLCSFSDKAPPMHWIELIRRSKTAATTRCRKWTSNKKQIDRNVLNNYDNNTNAYVCGEQGGKNIVYRLLLPFAQSTADVNNSLLCSVYSHSQACPLPNSLLLSPSVMRVYDSFFYHILYTHSALSHHGHFLPLISPQSSLLLYVNLFMHLLWICVCVVLSVG